MKFEVILIKLKPLFLGFKVIEVDTNENAPLVLACYGKQHWTSTSVG